VFDGRYSHHLELNLDAVDLILDDAKASKIESRQTSFLPMALLKNRRKGQSYFDKPIHTFNQLSTYKSSYETLNDSLIEQEMTILFTPS
jgi:hypothetical protein